jgi:copper chaperone CopZ
MTTFHIPDMSCGHCRATIEDAIQAIDAGAKLDFDMAARTLSLTSVADLAKVQAALAAAGYPATPA